MAKYSIIEADVIDGVINLEGKSEKDKKTLKENNVIYIYRCSEKNKKADVYIGQTSSFLRRNNEHFNGTEEKFNISNFDKVLVVISAYFDNRTALDDVEAQLITYFKADYQNRVINRTDGNYVNGYKESIKIENDIILPLWEQELFNKRKWVKTATLGKLRSDALVKYSPIKVLTPQQDNLINEIIENSDKNYVINGDAGTGKTVLLTNLVARILKEKPELKIGVIVQPNWENTGKKIFKVYGMNNKNLKITTSIKLINSKEKFDIIIVDESHKLSRRYNKQHNSFLKAYKINEYKDCKSHLEILEKMSNQLVLMYDVLQGIRPANVTREEFKKITENYEKRFLKTQFRIQTSKDKNYTSDDYINGIKYLLYKDTGLLESEFTNFNPNFNRDVFRDNNPDAYFGYYIDKPLHNLFDWIDEDNNYNPININRVLEGLVEDWRQKHGKDPNIKHWHEGNRHHRWNSKQEDWINSKDEDAKEQIGSVFAVQGIDLNKVGVLMGADLEVDEDGKLVGNPKNFYNVNGKYTKEEMKIVENRFEFTLFVLNIYYVLLTRGIDGIRVGFWHNDELRKYMEKILEIKK